MPGAYITSSILFADRWNASGHASPTAPAFRLIPHLPPSFVPVAAMPIKVVWGRITDEAGQTGLKSPLAVGAGSAESETHGMGTENR